MLFVCLAVVISITICLADDNLQYNQSMLKLQIEENIRELRQAKQRAEQEEREKNSLAALSDEMIKDSFQASLQSKMDILYDNHTDLTKELKFNPTIFNCGKEFDIFKLLDLAKAHRNITTEQPKCIEDLEEAAACPNEKPDKLPNGTNNKTIQGVTQKSKMLKNTVLPLKKNPAEVPPGVLPNPAAPTSAVSQAPVPPAPQPLTNKKVDNKPAERPQQPKTIKAKPPESKSYVRSKVADGFIAPSAQMVGARGNRAGTKKEYIAQQNGIVVTPATVIVSRQKEKSVNNPVNDYVLGREDKTQLDKSSLQLTNFQKQLPQVVRSKAKYEKVQEDKLQSDKKALSVLEDSLQKQQIAQVAPANQAAIQPEQKSAQKDLKIVEQRQQVNKIGIANENQIVKATGSVSSEQNGKMIRPAEQKVQAIAIPVTDAIQAQLIPQSIENPVLQISENSAQFQIAEPIPQTNQNSKLSAQLLKQQTLRPTADGLEQLPPNFKAALGTEQLSLTAKVAQASAQQQVQKEIPTLILQQQAAKPGAVGSTAVFLQANKPAPEPVQSPVQQSHQKEYIQQPVAKQPPVTAARIMDMGQIQVFATHQKTPVAPAVATERFFHQSWHQANIPQFVGKNVPTAAHVWGYNMFPYTAKLQHLEHIQNIASVSNSLEKREPSGNLQKYPKLDYAYYQDY